MIRCSACRGALLTNYSTTNYQRLPLLQQLPTIQFDEWKERPSPWETAKMETIISLIFDDRFLSRLANDLGPCVLASLADKSTIRPLKSPLSNQKGDKNRFALFGPRVLRLPNKILGEPIRRTEIAHVTSIDRWRPSGRWLTICTSTCWSIFLRQNYGQL